MAKILLLEHPVGSTQLVKGSSKSLNKYLTESAMKLPEGIRDDATLLRGPVQRANVENKNRRIYPRKILDREMSRLNEIIDQQGGVLGEIDHPDAAIVGLQRVPAVIRRL
jgi:hypothetical protein